MKEGHRRKLKCQFGSQLMSYINQGSELGTRLAGYQRGMAAADVAYTTNSKANGRSRISQRKQMQAKQSSKLRKNPRLFAPKKYP